MSSKFEMPTEKEIDEFYAYFLEYGFFHGDQFRIQEKDFVKLSSFFDNAFRNKGYSGGSLELGTIYHDDWGTIAWFCDPVKDHNNIANIIKNYIQMQLNK